jgi:hypothetical protein
LFREQWVPIIFDLKCSNCDYVSTASSTGFVILDDGTEEMLGHPTESVRAKTLSGLTLEELVRSGRIRYGHQLVCGACGELGLYPREELGLPTESGELNGYFAQLTYHPSDADAAHATCKSCGEHAVRGMEKLEGLTCPKCGRMTQSMEVGGIS